MKQEKIKFLDLPIECKNALMEWCHCETIKETERLYSHSTFTFEIISIDEAKKRCMEQSEDLWGCSTFEEYHQTYLQGGDIPNHGQSMYPVIEGTDDEWLIDGWHRFHSYILYDKKEIPVLSIQ